MLLAITGDSASAQMHFGVHGAQFIVKGEGQGIGPSKSSRQEGRASAPFHHAAIDGIMAMEGP